MTPTSRRSMFGPVISGGLLPVEKIQQIRSQHIKMSEISATESRKYCIHALNIIGSWY